MNRLATLTLIISAGFFISTSAQAQGDLKGPAYKNASPSEKYQGTSLVTLREDPKALKGPKAKNYKPFRDKTTEVKVVDLKSTETKYTKGLKGPEFKNYKPGK